MEYQPKILYPGKGLIPFQPWPFQQEILQNRADFRAVNKPRQCGVSTTFATEAAWKFDNVPGSVIVILSKDKDAAINFHRYIYEILYSVRENGAPSPTLVKENERETTNSIRSRIVSLPATKETGRSISASDIYFDEMAHAEYADEIFQASSPMIAQTGGTITALSTPKGRGNLFHRIFEEPGNKRQGIKPNMGFDIMEFRWWDVPTYNPYYKEYTAAKNAREEKYWIEKAKTGKWYRLNRPKYTDLAWAQEFEGSFDADQEMVFSTRQLEKSFWRNWLPEAEDNIGVCDQWYSLPAKKGHYYATGIDVGRKRDATVLITYDITVDPAEVVDYKYIPAGNADWDLLERVIRQTYEAYNKPDMLIDSSGSGDPIQERLSDIAEPFTFTMNKKEGIIQKVRLAMDHGVVRMPKIPRLFAEHRKYTWDDKNITQDTVMANALAIEAFYEADDTFIGVDSEFSYVDVQ